MSIFEAQTTFPMHEKIQQWETELNAITTEFEVFRTLTPEQFNFKPNSKTWSIAQIIDHIIVLNESYYPILKSVHNGSFKLPFTGRFDWAVNFFGKLVHDAVEPTRKRKGRTLPIWFPTSSKIGMEILDRFATHQQELIEWMIKSEPLIVKDTVIHSPANKIIVYKLEKAFDLIVTHEQRHLNQARQALIQLPTNTL